MTYQVFPNPAARPTTPSAGFAPEDRRPLRTHRSLPAYQPTPLHDSPGLARRLGVASVLVKDESTRLGLPSFKILGASWATLQAIARTWLDQPEADLGLDDTRHQLLALGDQRRGLAAATDGNHGRGVARMANLLNLACTILVPAGTAPARIDAIVSEGAQVRIIDGTYDDAIAESAKLADERTLIISDTSWGGYDRTPRDVINGYSTLFFEIDDEIAARQLRAPTFLAVQAGVGAFAAAAFRHYRASSAANVGTAVVEPSSANCLMSSAKAGRITEVPGPHRSHMAGLNCGLPSSLAWPVVFAGTDTFLSIDDEWAYEAMRTLAELGIEAGESGAAALAGLLALSTDRAAATQAGFGRDSHVLIVNTEGATDPVNYAAVTTAEQPQSKETR